MNNCGPSRSRPMCRICFRFSGITRRMSNAELAASTKFLCALSLWRLTKTALNLVWNLRNNYQAWKASSARSPPPISYFNFLTLRRKWGSCSYRREPVLPLWCFELQTQVENIWKNVLIYEHMLRQMDEWRAKNWLWWLILLWLCKYLCRSDVNAIWSCVAGRQLRSSAAHLGHGGAHGAAHGPARQRHTFFWQIIKQIESFICALPK